VLFSPIPDHVAPGDAGFYAVAVVLWLMGVTLVVYRKLRASS
jgi:hypothetical protein